MYVIKSIKFGQPIFRSDVDFVPFLHIVAAVAYEKPHLQMQQNLVLPKVKAGVGKYFYKIYFTIVFMIKILILNPSGSNS